MATPLPTPRRIVLLVTAVFLGVVAAWPGAASATPEVRVVTPACDASAVQVRFIGDGAATASALIETNGTTTGTADIPMTGTVTRTAQIAPRSRNEITVRVNGELAAEQTVGESCSSETPASDAAESSGSTAAGELPFTGAGQIAALSGLALLLIAVGVAAHRGHRGPTAM